MDVFCKEFRENAQLILAFATDLEAAARKAGVDMLAGEVLAESNRAELAQLDLPIDKLWSCWAWLLHQVCSTGRASDYLELLTGLAIQVRVLAGDPPAWMTEEDDGT